MEFKSQIRDSQIQQLFEKVDSKNYGKYLRKIRLNVLRGFQDETVSFDFPVTAIVGPNGGGKTTVLGVAVAYISVKPSRFFTKSGKFDSSMQNWSITYDLIDKDVNTRELINRTSKFKNYKWTREHLARKVAIFGVARTVPANERSDLRRCASTNFEVDENQINQFDADVIQAAEKILGKDLTGYSQIFVTNDGLITLLTGKTKEGNSFSEFHFGAGESSIIKMVLEIESLPDNSLILIEEIENGLHPVATVRMVEYLIEVAIRKKSQAIFTTHSNDALLPLPAKAIWSATSDKLFQGKLDVRSLRAITGQIETQLVIFVEDDFAKLWLEMILASSSNMLNDEIEVHKMEGDGNAVLVNKYHNLNPANKYKSICYIDGDSTHADSPSEKIYRLPGDYPETYIYDKILEKINSNTDSIIGELTVSLHKSFDKQNEIADIIKDIRRTNRDYHLLFSQLGKAIGFVSEIVVKSAFISLWIRNFPQEVESILKTIQENYQQNLQ